MDLCAVILAAGLSSRMKFPKPLLKIQNHTFLEHIIRTYRMAGIDDILVITGCNRDLVHPITKSMSVAEIENPCYHEGMYSSIRCGIRACREEISGVFVHPVDIPLVRPETIQSLGSMHRESDHRIRIPVFDEVSGHPPLIGSGFFRDILNYHGQDGLKGFFSNHYRDVDFIPVSDPGICMSMNTPEEYNEVVRLYG